MTKFIQIFVLYVFISFATASSTCADLLMNGNFDDFVPTNGTGGGWTSSALFFASPFPGGWLADGGNPGPRFVLNSGGQLSSDPSLSQTITGLSIGQTYSVNGQYQPIYEFAGNPSALSFGVLVDGVPILELSRGPSGIYTDFFSSFVATSTSHTITFAAERNGDDSSFAVDNLSVTGVPEPSGLACFTMGLLALSLRRSRRRVKRAYTC